ncbi:MAG: hydantoinase/oxoprolinase family protein [Salinirussus sp.]
MIRVGVDTGGTFTDAVLIDDGTVVAAKKPTTDDLISGVLAAFEAVCEERGVDPEEVDTFSHGHTVATNAIIEGTGAETALVTTEGFRDVLEAGEAYRDADLLYNPCGPVEDPLIPRRRRYEVPERLDADGEVIEPLDTEAAESLAADIEASEVESVAICLLHAHRNDSHERELAKCFDDVEISRSSAVSPEIREYPRTATTVVDAYISPTIKSYLGKLETELQHRGLSVPITVMKSDGGVARPDIVAERPVTQTISGPVAATRAAQYLGAALGLEDLLTLDMGGTSADTAMIKGGEPIEERHREIRGLKINGPFIDVDTIGAGGGSIARVTDVDSLRVGPESAGAEPGPVCYGKGGKRPTVTDADLILGLLNPEEFAGGELELDVNAARAALERDVADPLGMSVEEAAVAVRDVIDSKLASALRITTVEEGYDPREFALMGFGGAGPMHVCNVADELDIDRIIFPNNPGLTSAFGLLVTDVQHNYVRSIVEPLPDLDRESLGQDFADMISQGQDELESEGVASEDRSFRCALDMKYVGQAHHLTIPLDIGEDVDSVDDNTLEAAADAFESRHMERYDFVDEHNPIEVVNARVTAIGAVEDIELSPTGAASADAARRATRTVTVENGRHVDTPCYAWSELGAGAALEGPAIVELANSTIWIPPGFGGEVDRFANLVVTRESAA